MTGANGAWQPSHGVPMPMRPRLPTVDEALQYSPLSSIIPFEPNIIPFPSTLPQTPSTIFSNQEERLQTRRGLDALNAEASNSQSTSIRIQQTLQHLQHLLKADDLTQYKFKRAAQPPSFNPQDHTTHDTPRRAATPRLGAFSNMVLNNTDVSFRYPTPPSPSPKNIKEPHKRLNGSGQQQQAPMGPQATPRMQPTQSTKSVPSNTQHTPSKQQHIPQNFQQKPGPAQPKTRVAVVIPPPSTSHQEDVRLQPAVSSANVLQSPVGPLATQQHTQPAPATTASNQSEDQARLVSATVTPQTGFSVVIPSLPPSSQREEYQSFPEVDAKVLAREGLSKKRKRESADDNAALALSFDQRQKAEAAAQNLQALIGDVFEAEDQLQPDTSGVLPAESARCFVPGGLGGGELPVLTSHIQSRLDSAIHKVTSTKAFSSIPADSLSRLQKLCEGAVGSVGSQSLSLGEDWTEGDIEEWASRLGRAEHGLQAARIMLRIMTAGREEKQLYSEDILSTILEALKHVLDTCIVPVIEARNSEANCHAFKILSAQRKPLTSLLQMAGKVLKLLSDMITNVDVSESAITSVEFVSTTLIFVENAHTEKESALGIQRCEGIRRIAMDVLAKIFARYPDQRTFIFDEILTSLEKLPVTRQSARQFKMADGKPIQLVSALVMRLIQTSATRSLKDKLKGVERIRLEDGVDEEEDDASQEDQESPTRQTRIIGMDVAMRMHYDDLIEDLSNVSRPLYDDAQRNTQYLVKFMVQRALSATKTGDQPYRNLLDIFTEDFLSVLGSADWPAAELLLRALLSNMIGLVENDKSAAPAKNMALDLMGTMGSGISDLQLSVKNAIKSMDTSESELSSKLVQTAEEIMDDRFEDSELLAFDGSYRVVLEYLSARDLNDPQIQSAKGYHLTQWSRDVCAFSEAQDTDDEDHSLPKSLAAQLRNMVLDPKWLEQEYDFETVMTSQGILAAAMTSLRLPFCKALKRIFNILLNAMTSDQATVKSRSLKSVVQLLEKDPSILKNGNYIINHILRCCADASPLVRDSALGLLGKCLTFKPSLEHDVCDRIIARTADAAIGVRKRAMKLLKDVYLRNDSKDIKTAIADALLQRIRDLDESVSDLARTTFEEIWIAPFYGSSDDAAHKLRLQNQVSLIIKTVQRGESVLSVLDILLQNVLSSDSKNNAANFNVCKNMVALMFDGVVDSNDLPEAPSQQHILQTLTVFAKANPKLFTGDQLQLLQPYVQNLSNTDDLLIYRSVIVIFRYVLPSLSSLQNNFLKAVQDALLSSVSKLGKMELNEVSQCLWIIDGVLKNTERLVRLTISVINGIYASKETNFNDITPQTEAALKRVKRYMMIAGYFGKSCNFDAHASAFKEKFPWWKGSSVAGLIVDVICPFTRQKQPHALREMAFESMGMICQSWPNQFLRTDTTTAFELVFHNQDPRLEHIVLSTFKGFFANEEKRSESGAEIKVGEGVSRGHERLDVSLVASDNDGACTVIAQRFLQHIIRIALQPGEDLALTAAQVIASINRQGLVHPKECGPALIALETSPNNTISNIAFQEHRTLHHKHESMFEKEYMKAVQRAFDYQREVFQDVHGATTQPFASKLRALFEVLKGGNAKIRKKFLLNLSSKVDFDFAKLDSKGEPPTHSLFARFCLENLAFFEYVRVDELLALVSHMEKIVTNTGTPVAHAIEVEVLKVRLDVLPVSQLDPGVDQQQPAFAPEAKPDPMVLESSNSIDVEPTRLKHLATAAVVMSMLWETRTHLRRLWGLQKQNQSGNPNKISSKTTIKDLNKAPTRIPFITHDKYWDKMQNLMGSISGNSGDEPSLEAMAQQCKTFAELLAIDNELKVTDQDDEEAELVARAEKGYETPSEDDGSASGSQPPSGGRGRKRKGSVSMNGTPKKKKGPSRPSGSGGKKSTKRSMSSTSHDEHGSRE
ncbi:uncharacterized protein K452DRAFT_307032 [Aplosporella prunicola CBS 121167]|uniref:Sister chromatid cohesion protein n=1 Tax=Aplosporella prunicola CBS 121167 TaxID=1176127 RepID=A0A6A6BJ23_9PEZI|nr:uncharacterized protein K452DRAFT_307032 [Aplosporella prunicola CBS 121167]KAF2143638.1 hypothetical protein K452DRAFT_307032 [Aplosporella prunicola CBS 121167]